LRSVTLAYWPALAIILWLLFHSRHRVARIVGLFDRKVIFQEMHPNRDGELNERRRTRPSARTRQEEDAQEKRHCFERASQG